jgi:hypothetical protein
MNRAIHIVDKDDVAAELVNDFNCGYVAEFEDQAENKKILIQCHNINY